MKYIKTATISPEDASHLLPSVGKVANINGGPAVIDSVEQNDQGEWKILATLLFRFEGGPADGKLTREGPGEGDSFVLLPIADGYLADYRPDPGRVRVLVFDQISTEDELVPVEDEMDKIKMLPKGRYRYTLHTVYDAVEVDDRFWVSTPDGRRCGPEELGGIKLQRHRPTQSICEARDRAAVFLGCAPAEIGTAEYLKHWEGSSS